MKILIKEKLSEHKLKTPEGYLICQDAILARTGDQGYLKSEIYEDFDGEDAMIQVQRKPEQVFSAEALASFEDKPITIEHPDENVGPDNYSELAVGHTRNIRKGKFNGQDVMIGDLVITDTQAIEEIENGTRTELSCGYDCDITEGDHPEQINIRGNHVALCKEGRAGIAKIIDSKIPDAKLIKEYIEGEKWIKVPKKVYYEAFGVWPKTESGLIGDVRAETEKAWQVLLMPQTEWGRKDGGWKRNIEKLVWVPKSISKELSAAEVDSIISADINKNKEPEKMTQQTDASPAKKKIWWTVGYGWPDDASEPYTATMLVLAEDTNEAEAIAKSWHPKIKFTDIRKGRLMSSFDAEEQWRMKPVDLDDAESEEETEKCAWCEEEFQIADLKKETSIGYLCPHCIEAIRSHGEKLTIEDTDDAEIGLKDFIKQQLSPEYVTESKNTVVARFAAREDASRAIKESEIKDLDFDIIDDESAYYLVYQKEDLKNYINEKDLLTDSVEEKYVVYNDGTGLSFTNFENYNSRIQNTRAIYAIHWAETFEDAIEYLIKYFKIPRENIITIGDPVKKIKTADANYRTSFYKKGIKTLEKKLDDIIDENADSVKDENEPEFNHQKHKVFKMIKEHLEKYSQHLKEAEEDNQDSYVKDAYNLNRIIKDWYLETYPNDDEGLYLDDTATFQDLFDCLDNKQDIQMVLGDTMDSVVRERIFQNLAVLIDSDYDYIYTQWLKSNAE